MWCNELINCLHESVTWSGDFKIYPKSIIVFKIYILVMAGYLFWLTELGTQSRPFIELTVSAFLHFLHTLVTVHLGDVNQCLNKIQTPLVASDLRLLQRASALVFNSVNRCSNWVIISCFYSIYARTILFILLFTQISHIFLTVHHLKLQSYIQKMTNDETVQHMTNC